MGGWEKEMAKFGFAIIHNKVVVIDPFSDNCTAVTGSHNLGFRASHNNDENMLIVRGHRGLAETYACHVLDLYDHYAWRFLIKEHPEIFGRPLQPDDTWQERYIIGKDEKSPELPFWLSAAAEGDTASSGTVPPKKGPAKKAGAQKKDHESNVVQEEDRKEKVVEEKIDEEGRQEKVNGESHDEESSQEKSGQQAC